MELQPQTWFYSVAVTNFGSALEREQGMGAAGYGAREGAPMVCKGGCRRRGGGAAMACEAVCGRRGGGAAIACDGGGNHLGWRVGSAASDEKRNGWRPVSASSSASASRSMAPAVAEHGIGLHGA
jgi:hypothetical protein